MTFTNLLVHTLKNMILVYELPELCFIDINDETETIILTFSERNLIKIVR